MGINGEKTCIYSCKKVEISWKSLLFFLTKIESMQGNAEHEWEGKKKSDIELQR